MTTTNTFVKRCSLIGCFVWVTALGVADAQSIRCANCTRYPTNYCMPTADWSDLGDQGCIAPPDTPCRPNSLRRYTIDWAIGGNSPEQYTVLALGDIAQYQELHPGCVTIPKWKSCQPTHYQPIGWKGYFRAEYAGAVATPSPLLMAGCGAPDGMVITYYADVSCSFTSTKTGVTVTKNCS